MNKEILEWIKLRVKNCQKISKDEFLPTEITDRSKKELKILDLLKKELEEKDKWEKMLNSKSRTEEPMKEPILDEVEKRYLKNVITPFKDRCIYIKKRNDCETGMEYLHFKLLCNDDIYFPYFKKGTMYKGMVNGKEYTLEELGITYE